MRKHLTFAQQTCLKSAGRVMQQTGMLYPGARLGVAVSGGVDSFVLLEVLRRRQRIVPFHFDLLALHLNPGFAPDNHQPLVDWLAAHGVASHVEVTDFGPRGHSAENLRNSPCFYCARLRRKRLFELCRTYRLTHLAFGHTADDLVITFFMNLLQNGRVDGLSMKEPFFHGELMVIRPLLLVEKAAIIKAARQWQLPVWKNPCPSAGKTTRADMEQLVRELAVRNKLTRKNLYSGLCRWQFAHNRSALASVASSQRDTVSAPMSFQDW